MAKPDNVSPIQDTEWAQKLIKALQAFRAVDPDMTANQLLTLLYVAAEPGISQRELRDEKRLDLPPGSAARVCAVLSERGNRGTRGKGLIEIGDDSKDYRVTAQRLSPKGRRLVSRIREIMED